MHFKHLYALFAIGFGCLLASCHSDIDLKNIDTTMEARVKLALPVGGFRAKVSDFLGSNDSAQIYLDENGVLTWKMDFHEDHEFERIDLTENLSDVPVNINVYDHLVNATYIDENGDPQPIMQDGNKLILPPGLETYRDSLVLNMPITFDDINEEGKLRIDSAYFNVANLDVVVNTVDFTALKWEWIDKIIIDLGTQLDWEGPSNRYNLYTSGVTDVQNFGEDLPFDLGSCTIHLTKDRTAEPSYDNVVEKLDLTTIVYFHIPSPTVANVYPTSKIECYFKPRELDVNILWGWFATNTDLNSKGDFDIDSLLGSVSFLNETNIPLAAPEIKLDLATSVAGDTKVSGQLYSIDAEGQNHYAQFNGKDYFDWRFAGVDPGDMGTLGDTTKISLLFDNTASHGEIPNLFKKFPKKIAYDISCNFDEESTPQIRIQKDLFINIDGSVKLPFAFDRGLKIEIEDTIKDINISRYHIDSLLSEVKIIDSVRIGEEGVWLLMAIYDSIPADLYATLTCLDENNQPIEDPELPGKNFILFPESGDTIHIQAFEQAGTLLKCQMTQKRLDLFPRIKSIVYMVGMEDASNTSAGTVIQGHNSLEAYIALTADIKAYIDPANSKK